jgi:hypothetical protein
MKRHSLIGPLILIIIGAAILANNLGYPIAVWRLLGDYWPFLLIAWGGLRLVEVVFLSFSGKPLPRSGIPGGEWVLIILICVFGSVIFQGRQWATSGIRIRGMEDLLGQSYDYQHTEQKMQAGKTPLIIVENLRGNTRITGGDTEEIVTNGRTTIRAFQKVEADNDNANAKLEIVKQGDRFLVRSNQDRASNSSRISSDIEIVVPRGATIEGRGRYGDFDVTQVAGVSIDSENAGVRVNEIKGSVRFDLRRSDVVRATAVTGSVDVKTNGNDIEMDGIGGSVTLLGGYNGELSFRKIAGKFRYQSNTTELTFAAIPGQVRMARGNLNGDNFTGPMLLKTTSKDVDLSDFTGSVQMSVERGNVDLRPNTAQVGPMDIKTTGGDIRVTLTPSAKFQLEAASERGSVENDYGAPIETTSGRKGGSMKGSVGIAGPIITLNSERGTITVRKGTDAPAATKQ